MDDKRLVGLEAAKYVKDGMVVGLGTGSTATHFIRELARRIREESLAIRCVPSSIACSLTARAEGISLLSVDQVSRVDLYVDGADEVAPDKGLIKGRGAAMVGEKLLAEACDAFIVIVDAGKLVDRLGGKFPVPVEILPAAILLAQRGIAALGGAPTLRQAAGKDGPVVTDNGNLILDVVFRVKAPLGSPAPQWAVSDAGSQGAEAAPDWKALDAALDSIPGVVGHGLFLKYAPKSTVLVGAAGGVRTLS